MATGFKTATVRSGDVPATQTNFPSYVDLDRLGITTLAEAESVRVYADSGKTTEWAREIVSATEMHVKVPSLTSTVEIFVDWDGVRSDYATTATYGAENVWDSNYKLVAHDVDDDSTSGANNGTLEGSTAVITGKVGDGRQFEATGNRVNYGSSFGESYSAATYSTWIRVNNTSNKYHPIGKRDNFGYTVETSGQIRAAIYTNDWQTPVFSGGSYTVTAGTWHKIDIVYTGSNLSIYFDGVSTGAGVSATGTLGNNGYNWFAGSYFVTSQWLDGDLDELRVSDIARSSDWLETSFNNENDEATFWGTWTDAGGGGGGAAQTARRGVIMMM